MFALCAAGFGNVVNAQVSIVGGEQTYEATTSLSQITILSNDNHASLSISTNSNNGCPADALSSAQVTGTAVTGQRLPMGATITVTTINILRFNWTPATQHTGTYKICFVGSSGGKAVLTLNPPTHTTATADLVASTAGQLDTGDTLTASASVSGATFHSSVTYSFYSCNFSAAQTLSLRPGDGQLIGADGNIITTGTAAGQCATADGNVSGTGSSRTYTIAASDASNQRFIYYTVRQTADTATSRPAIAGVSSGIRTEIMPDGETPSETPSDNNQQTQTPPPQNMTNTSETPQPPAASSSSSGGIALLAIAGAGGYYYWKKRQIQSGNAAKMALLPDVNFDLDRNDRRAFFTKMNWQNPGNSNWQLRGNAQIHTKYSGKLLDWNANSHIGYRLNGKFGDFNPYAKAKFVQNDPENAKMIETYTLGVNYAIPNRFSVQFLQPDDEIWRYSLKTEMHLPKGISLRFNQPNSDIWRYSANLNWQISERIGLNLSQLNNDLPNYGFGVQWRGKSQIRYGISGETGSNSYRLSGSYAF